MERPKVTMPMEMFKKAVTVIRKVCERLTPGGSGTMPGDIAYERALPEDMRLAFKILSPRKTEQRGGRVEQPS